MSETTVLESIKLLSDWAKWLTTIQTGVIALIVSLFTSKNIQISLIDKVFSVLSISCFVLSIVAAAMLIWTLPTIAQSIRPNMNIWNTGDSVALRLFRMNTRRFSIALTGFFLFGLLFLTLLIFSIIIF
jgi:hypothetical protein